MGLGFTFSLTLIGTIREVLGSGQAFGYQVMWDGFKPFTIMVEAPGAFIVLGGLLAGMNCLMFYQARKKGLEAVPAAACSGCGACHLCEDK
jgi:electron transport complex protein RnfE